MSKSSVRRGRKTTSKTSCSEILRMKTEKHYVAELKREIFFNDPRTQFILSSIRLRSLKLVKPNSHIWWTRPFSAVLNCLSNKPICSGNAWLVRQITWTKLFLKISGPPGTAADICFWTVHGQTRHYFVTVGWQRSVVPFVSPLCSAAKRQQANFNSLWNIFETSHEQNRATKFLTFL